MVDEPLIGRCFGLVKGQLDERQRRCLAAAMAVAIGEGGISVASRATGVSRRTIRSGVAELKAPKRAARTLSGRIRKPGGGRKRAADTDATLRGDLEALLEPVTRGDPQSPLRWTCKSVRQLSRELTRKGHRTSHRMVAEMLHAAGYSLQANRKTLEGASHPDRDAQFHYIHRKAREYLRSVDPVISVDTKKKELVGTFKNGGREWHPQGEPVEVQVHDFLDPALGRAIPYGVYDLASDSGWVSVGCDHDTAGFAVETIRRWWHAMGQPLYPDAKRLLITADAGGSNGARLRLWKVELQKFAHEIGLPVAVCHFPPGTSKWNKIEHRMFAFITMNWRGRPLTSHEVIVNSIAATTTQSGLKLRAALDTNRYPAGIKVTRKQVDAINLKRSRFHGDWNYTILP